MTRNDEVIVKMNKELNKMHNAVVKLDENEFYDADKAYCDIRDEELTDDMFAEDERFADLDRKFFGYRKAWSRA